VNSTLPQALFIDGFEFSKQSLEIHDKIRASHLPGLMDIVTSGDGEVEFCLLGGFFGGDKPMLRLQVQGALNVRCQRCLGELRYRVEVSRDFVLVARESAIPEDELEDDTVDYLVASRNMDVMALLEEELILSLPIVLAHEGGCGVDQQAALSKAARPNPFQVLEGLKKRRQI
jgi:uncharacterized protein